MYKTYVYQLSSKTFFCPGTTNDIDSCSKMSETRFDSGAPPAESLDALWSLYALSRIIYLAHWKAFDSKLGN
jgi:hypothetical protein